MNANTLFKTGSSLLNYPANISSVLSQQIILIINPTMAFNTFEDLSWFVYKTPPDTLFYSYPDTFLVKKQIHTFNLRVGEQLKRGRFIIDFNVGLGIRYRDVIHLNRINTQDKMLQPRHPNIGYANVVDGKFFMINIPMAIKIGFLF
ncbi:MAG: hypothetical protein K0S32_4562 [Bacteroidetes bacterium]|nr:hypothetical protein [Bacteroidota bacterium]